MYVCIVMRFYVFACLHECLRRYVIICIVCMHVLGYVCLYVCVLECMYVLGCKYVFIHELLWFLCVFIWSTFLATYLCVELWIWVCVYICRLVHSCICVLYVILCALRIYKYVCVWVFVSNCVCVYEYSTYTQCMCAMYVRACERLVYLKSIEKLNLLKQKLAMNETLIFFKIDPFAFNTFFQLLFH